LTNDEIAERLGITSDGVKYHVSQILTKLGVESRHEAVAAAYSETGRRWWSVALASTLGKAAGLAVVAGAVAFLAILIWGAFRSGGSGDVPDVSGLTAADVFARAEQAANRPGEVLHSRIEGTRSGQGYSAEPYYSMELWVDAASETIRSEYQLAPGQGSEDLPKEGTSIVSGKYGYVPDDPGQAYRINIDLAPCPGFDAAWLALLFLCQDSLAPNPVGEPHVQDGDFRGRSAIVISYEASQTEPEAVTSAWRVYLDGGYLPFAYSFAQRAAAGDQRNVTIEAVYDNEFIPLDEDMRTLLDPHSIGYGVENAGPSLDEIAARVPVYWLGEDFAGDGLGDLVLTQVLVGEQQGGVQQTYQVGGELVYQGPDGYPEVHLFLWRKDDWDAFLTGTEGRVLTDPACARAEVAGIGGMSATVYVMPELQFGDVSTPVPAQAGITESPRPGPYESECNFQRRQLALVDRIMGIVQFGDVVVQVRQDGEVASAVQMQGLLQQLRAR
jgi:hypothetical protein